MNWLKIFKKTSKQPNLMLDFVSKERRKARNKRYYSKNKEKLKQNRREYYLINNK